jgi:hypothetical protein
LREDYHHKSTVYGLLDKNLRELEKAGKCSVLRHERFVDRHSGLEGMLCKAICYFNTIEA